MNFAKTTFTLLLTILIVGCSTSKDQKNIIRIKGSDTMLPLCRRFATIYNMEHPGMRILVEGGGTAKGFEALEKGEIDICSASRNVEPNEVKELAEKTQNIGMSFLVAKDALFVYVNSSNPIASLSRTDLKDIFECRLNNWNKFISFDTSIVLVLRSESSGTLEYFRNHVLNGEKYCREAIIKNSNEELFTEIANRKNAIGFAGVSSANGIKSLKIDGIEPTIDNIINDKYPVVRYLLFYTVKEPTGEIKQFIDWTISQEGQEIIRESGYVPLWENLEIK